MIAAILLLMCVVGGSVGSPVEQPLYVNPGPHLDQRLDGDSSGNAYAYDDGQYREELYDNANSIPGVPGVDYPILASIPRTSFACSGKLPGFYADEEADCQVWHYCKTDGHRESFLCPNGTMYNQVNRVCEWWFNVQCENTGAAFRVNEDLYIIPPTTPIPDDQLYYPDSEDVQPEFYPA